MLSLDVDSQLCNGDFTPQKGLVWQETAKIFPCSVPLSLRRPRSLAICHCVYIHQPGNYNLRNISYRCRQLWAVSLWISLTWILSFRSRATETFVPHTLSHGCNIQERIFNPLKFRWCRVTTGGYQSLPTWNNWFTFRYLWWRKLTFILTFSLKKITFVFPCPCLHMHVSVVEAF